MGELQKELLSDPKMNQTVQEVLKNPEALDAFKNFFKGGSKWKKKHTRNRKKRGSGGTHSKPSGNLTPFHKHMGRSLEQFPFVAPPTTMTEQGEEMSPVRGEKKRRGAADWDWALDLDTGDKRRPTRKVFDEGSSRISAEEKIYKLRKEAEAMKKEIQKKHEKDIATGKKVMYGGKRKKRRSRRKSRRKSRRRRRRRKRKRTRRKRR